MITDEQLKTLLPPYQGLIKIGNRTKAIALLRDILNRGECEDTFENLRDYVQDGKEEWLVRIGNTYYRRI